MFLLIAETIELWCCGGHFNTSHVSINLDTEELMDTVVTDFNTSHVSINRNRASGEWNHLHISIHLMFLLILYHISYRIPKNIISIHLMFLLI